MLRAGLVTLLLLLAGCSAAPGSEEPRDLRVERISSDAPGQGPRHPQAVVAPSAAALSGEIGANVPDSGSGTYLAVYWGEKPTGGYSMSVRSARLEGSRVTVRLALREPPRDAILTQALTYPYAVAVIRELDPGGKHFSFVDENGRALGWPVRRV
ncbi:MAG: protease complex subunit PrcB family protein [Rubrobacteraceae bacterium]